jgi:hypothetical protein
MRDPCGCGCVEGYIKTKNGNDCVFCAECGDFKYNAPKTETGRAPRTVQTTHRNIKPKQRARILMRANGHCELCGSTINLHVSHLVSVDAGIRLGMSDPEINSDDNLFAGCAQCNLGIGKEIVPPRLLAKMCMARMRNIAGSRLNA